MTRSLSIALSLVSSLLISACGDAGPQRSPEYKAYTQLREKVRTSPDHLRARAKEVVASSQPQAIHDFVRDQFLVLPPAAHSLNGFESRVRWGSAGLLRSGAGTPREQVDLLVELFQEAGFSAVAMQCTPMDALNFREMFQQSFQRRFAPDLTLTELQKIAVTMGGSVEGEDMVLDPGGEERRLLADKLSAALDDTRSPRGFDAYGPRMVPVVALEIDGDTKYLAPWNSGAGFGDSPCAEDPSEELPPSESPEVRITLSARGVEPGEATVLVEHTWNAEELVGNEVWIQFLSDLDPKSFLLRPFDAPHSFTPVLSLRSKVDESVIVNESVPGTGITSSGDLITESPDGSVLINGELLGGSEASPEQEARVASIETFVDARNFPNIELNLLALDSQGLSVEGLRAASFEVLEEGQAMRTRLLRELPATPRLLFLLDQSGSVPDAFQGENMKLLIAEFVQEIGAQDPDAEYLVCGVFGCAPNDWTQDAAELQGQVEDVQVASFGSDFWSALADVMQYDQTIVVLISDGDFTDELTDERRATITAGVPVVTLGVGPVVQETLDLITALTGGDDTLVETQQEASDAAVAFLRNTKRPPYKLVYRAPLDGSAIRNLQISMRAETPGDTASYVRPETDKAIGFAGLWLTVESNGRSVTRSLAGMDDMSQSYEGTQEDVDEVLAQFFGTALVSFSGYGPTVAHMFDEMLTARLSTESVVRASESGDLDEMLDALSDGYISYAGKVELVQAQLPQGRPGDGLTYPEGLRAVLINRAPRFGMGMVSKLDILPLTTWQSVALDAEEAWQTTLERTLTLALAEAAAFPVNAVALTGDSEFLVATFYSMEEVLLSAGVDGEHIRVLREAASNNLPDGASSMLYVIPNQPMPQAFWSVDGGTGDVLSLLLDGSGGSALACESDQLTRDSAAASLLQTFAGLTGLLPPGIGTWVSLGLTMRLIAARAAVILGTIGDPNVDADELQRLSDKLQQDLRDMIKNLAKSGLPKLPGQEAFEIGDSIGSSIGQLTRPTPEGC